MGEVKHIGSKAELPAGDCCGKCRHWFKNLETMGQDGDCRLNPPVPFLGFAKDLAGQTIPVRVAVYWPATRPDLVCGQFSPRIEQSA